MTGCCWGQGRGWRVQAVMAMPAMQAVQALLAGMGERRRLGGGPGLGEGFGLFEDGEGGLFLSVRRVAVFAEEAADEAAEVGADVFAAGPVDGDVVADGVDEFTGDVAEGTLSEGGVFGVGLGEGGYGESQGLTMSMPIPWKSRTLRVAIAKPCALAVPAMRASPTSTARPAWRGWARSSAAQRAPD